MWKRIVSGRKSQQFCCVPITFEMPLRHLGGGRDGHSNMELKGEIGVGVIVAMRVVHTIYKP